MKKTEYAGNEERTILTSLIVHDGVLQKVYERVGKDRDPFRSRWSNLIARWCFEHFEKYHKAPRRNIQGAFEDFSKSSQDDDAIQLVESFIGGLNEDYKGLAAEINELYLTDLAGNYFERIKLGRLAETIQDAIERNDLPAAKEAQQTYQGVQFGERAWVDPFEETEVKSTFTYYEQDRSLIKFAGALGIFLSPHFEADGFVAFAGPEKRGKSFWLQEVVWQALRQRRRVLYYVFGDMSKEQVKRRLFTRIARKPWKPKVIEYPVYLKPGGPGDEQEVEFRSERRAFEAITTLDVLRAKQKLEAVTASRSIRLKLMCAGGGVVCAGDIEKDVESLARQDWLPEVVVVDYADLLAPEPGTGRLDKRHQIDMNWQTLRRISLRWHLLMVTATQAATRGYDARILRNKDFSEDKRKNAHVTGMVGINQFGEEKRNGIYRLNWILLRDGEWSPSQVVWTAGRLSLANPCIISALPERTAQDNTSNTTQE